MVFSGDALWILVGALVLDALVGDPDWLWRRWPHPVVWLGRLVATGDEFLNLERWSDPVRRAAGAVGLLALVAVALASGYAIEVGLRALPAGLLWLALAASILLAGRSLYDHVRRVDLAFAAGGITAARHAVSMIVGRDPASLDEAGIARAAIESAAENVSDGLVAPAFWFALLGLPGLVAYKAVNTADSMIGHLSPRHRAFGWAAARFDDLVNLVPARLSGLAIALAAPAAGGRIGIAWRVMVRDAGIHRSPNAGWPESAMAGALNLRLAGPRVYAAGPVDEPFLNPEGGDATPRDIDRALRVMVAAGALHAALWLGLALALGW
ncbi:adenosylcobinamide-phosphate synthase CbiB [uncultured Enterovirga sp.]|uniref:adenosylcobinamide-phosphate synthase CbiB n=1 Tax=uncultured Enterovirga sp. TaxID=2026352 RepID=UPI0035CAAFBC